MEGKIKQKNKPKKGIHDGHRERVKKRYRENGLDHFEPHQVLELLLFYAYPRGDTNEKAHQILNEFGSLDAVFDASVEDIMERCHVTENVALLLSMPKDFYKAYLQSKNNKDNVLNTLEKIGTYAIALFTTSTVEEFHLICLDKRKRVRFHKCLGVGTETEVLVDMNKFLSIATQKGVSYVIVTHNHPSGLLAASVDDMEVTRKVQKMLEHTSVRLLDHIIVADEDYYSFAEKRLLRLSLEKF